MTEQEIFERALDKAPQELPAFLEVACAGDTALLRRLETLLQSHAEAGQFLEEPAIEQLAAAAAKSGNSGDDLSFLSPSSEPGSLGRLDRYEVLEVVGRGGMGIVLRARDSKLERVVALKVLAAPLAASATARRRFAREARATAAVREDHVVAIYEVRDDAPIPYLAMEFIGGCTLADLLRSGPLEVNEILRIGVQIAHGLAAAHQHGLIHRDVKPANILLENGVQRVKLTDFGLARAADDASVTQLGFIAGTPLYMAPEQANGEPLDARADLFGLGSVLYEMCAGFPAFRAPNTAAVIHRVCYESPRPIREVNPDVPESLCRLIERLHAKKPADRPATATEAARLLADISEGHVFDVPDRQARWKRAPRKWLCAAAALVLLAAGLGLSEATGVTNMRGTVIRLFSPEGTLVVEVEDPGVSVTVDGGDVVITGAGAKEIRLKPGQYKIEASKDGKLVRQELVTVKRDGRQVVRISKELKPLTAAEVWQKSVAALPAEKQVEAVARRLKERNIRFDGRVEPTIRDGIVAGLRFNTDLVDDLSPVRALTRLESLDCLGSDHRQGCVTELSPLCGLPLKRLIFEGNHVSDLSPLRDMPLELLSCGGNLTVKDLTPLKGLPLWFLCCRHTNVTDLSPLKGMKLTMLWCDQTRVSDLTPLRGMPLKEVRIPYTQVSDLTPLRGMPLEVLVLINAPISDLSPLRGMALKQLDITGTKATDLSPIRGMPLTKLWLTLQPDRDTEIVRSLQTLQTINNKPAAEFWKEVDGK